MGDEQSRSRSEGAPRTSRAGWALAGLSLAMLLSSLGTSVANVALPTLEEAFDASFAQVQWVVLAYLLAITTLVVSAGRLGDLIGRRRLLVLGIATFTTASALCALAPSLPLLVAARAVQGTGAAIMMALTLAFVTEAVAKARTGSAMGLLGTTSAIGTALGPSLGGLLIAGVGWRAIFLVNVPLGLLALGLAYRHLPADRPRTEPRPRFDALGTLLLALTLAAYALAMTIEHGRLGSLGVVLLAGAATGAALFVVVEARAKAPLVRAGMLRDPGLRAGLATSALVSTVMMATLVVGPFYLAGVLGLNPALVGLAMSVGPAVVVLAGVPAGRIADGVGTGRLSVVGLTTMAAGALLLSVTPARFGVPGYIAPIIVVTLGYALFQTANNTAVMAAASPDQRGVTSGMLNLSRNLGLVTGASVMGTVFTLGVGTTSLESAPPEAVATGMHLAFAVAAVLLGAALVIAVGDLRRRPRARRRRGFRGNEAMEDDGIEPTTSALQKPGRKTPDRLGEGVLRRIPLPRLQRPLTSTYGSLRLCTGTRRWNRRWRRLTCPTRYRQPRSGCGRSRSRRRSCRCPG